MKINKFLNIDVEPAPLEMKLDVEMRCREIMASNDIDTIKRYSWLKLVKNLMVIKSIIMF